MEALAERNDGEPYFQVNRSRPYRQVSRFNGQAVTASSNFAFDMTFGKAGAHKVTRSGGAHARSAGEVFANAFQGKLAEFAVADLLKSVIDLRNIAPTLDTSPLGVWDGPDLEGPGFSLEVKSAKSFSNLLLLEEGNWTKEGQYRHGANGEPVEVSHVVLVRIHPNIDRLMVAVLEATAQAEDARTKVLAALGNESWGFDCPGYLDREALATVFQTPFLISKGDRLGTRGTRMDASNYYAQASDLQPIDQLFLERRDNRRVALGAGPTSGLAVEQEPASHAPGEERGEHKAQKTTVRFRELTSERPKAPARVAQETDPGQQDRRGKYWTRAEDETLISMLQAGASHSAIAKNLGRTPYAVWRRAKNLYVTFAGLSMGKSSSSEKDPSQEQIRAVEALYLEGKAFSEIAESTRLSLAQSIRILFKARLLPPVQLDDLKYSRNTGRVSQNDSSFPTNGDNELLMRRYAEGLRLREIAQLHGVTPYAVFSHLFEAGLVTVDQLEAMVELTR